ncbi:MAG: ABC transporter substrate-binding protein [Treponema sp.]|nr:ABC transporter substrate-binding protein [Treponema sp.]
MIRRNGAVLLIASVFSTVLLVTTGCSKKSEGKSSSDPVYVGTSFPMTGTIAADGKLILDAIQLAVDETNGAGGIKGRKIQLQSEDDGADPSTAAAVANKFASDSKIVSVVTSYNSSCGLAQIPIYKSVGLTAISPVTTSPAITGISPYYYRTCNSDAFGGIICAEFCQKLGMKNVYILYENDDYGMGIEKVYEDKIKSFSMSVAGIDSFIYGQTKDFSTIITKIRNAKPDGIMFIGLVTELGLLMNQSAGFDCPVFADDGCYSPALIAENGAAVEKVYSLGPFSVDDPDPKVHKFVTDYETKFNGSEPSLWSALAYDAAMTLFEAMKSCTTIDRESINTAMQNISYQGITGLNKFVNGDVEKHYSVFQVQNGKWEKVQQ